MVITGLSEVIGSWKIIEMSRPRMARISSSASCEEVDAVEADRAADDAAGRIGDQPHQRQRGHALAAAGFADDRQRLAARDRKRHAVDGLDRAVAGEEVGFQVAM